MNRMQTPQLDNFLAILHDSSISKAARLIYLDIKAESQLTHGLYYGTDKVLAANFNMARESISNALTELERSEYIHRETKRKGLDIATRTITQLKWVSASPKSEMVHGKQQKGRDHIKPFWLSKLKGLEYAKANESKNWIDWIRGKRQ